MRTLWRNRDYMILWSGQAVSAVGTAVSQLALPLLVLALTGSPAQTGFAAFLESLPYVILALPAGALVDRWDRKAVMIGCDFGRFLAFGSVPLAAATGHLSVGLIYAAVTVHGILMTFFSMAGVAALTQVVTKEQLPAATAQNQAAEEFGVLLGPPIGGFLFQTMSHTFPFLIDSLSYLASVVSLLLIRTRFQEERIAVRRRLLAEIAEGVRWLWDQRLIRFLAVLTGTGNFVFAGVVLMVIFLARGMGASPAAIGALYTAAAVGGLAGTLVAPFVLRRLPFGRIVLVFVWVQAILFPLLAFAPNLIVMGLIAAGLIFVSPIYNTVQMSYRLGLIPDELQGRVNSVYRLTAFALNPLGAALAGLLTQWVGAARGVVLLSSVLVLMAILSTMNRELRTA
jgi:predicted MFS family arabinose efflux permease